MFIHIVLARSTTMHVSEPATVSKSLALCGHASPSRRKSDIGVSNLNNIGKPKRGLADLRGAAGGGGAIPDVRPQCKAQLAGVLLVEGVDVFAVDVEVGVGVGRGAACMHHQRPAAVRPLVL